VQLAVLVGSAIDPSKPTPVGNHEITTNTLWGNMAYQLGGRKGYELVREADRKSVAPGANTLVELFDAFGPCIILVDELVAYARNIYNKMTCQAELLSQL